MLVILRAREACRGDGVTVDAWEMSPCSGSSRGAYQKPCGRAPCSPKLPRPEGRMLSHEAGHGRWRVAAGDSVPASILFVYSFQGCWRQFPRLYHPTARPRHSHRTITDRPSSDLHLPSSDAYRHSSACPQLAASTHPSAGIPESAARPSSPLWLPPTRI
jgi:hypothetical protein